MEKSVITTASVIVNDRTMSLTYYIDRSYYCLNFEDQLSGTKIDFRNDGDSWYCDNPEAGFRFCFSNKMLDDILRKLRQSQMNFIRLANVCQN